MFSRLHLSGWPSRSVWTGLCDWRGAKVNSSKALWSLDTCVRVVDGEGARSYQPHGPEVQVRSGPRGCSNLTGASLSTSTQRSLLTYRNRRRPAPGPGPKGKTMNELGPQWWGEMRAWQIKDPQSTRAHWRPLTEVCLCGRECVLCTCEKGLHCTVQSCIHIDVSGSEHLF